MLGAYTPVAAAQSNAKVVIIVGADTPQYVDDANQVYNEAIKYTPNVVKVYSPKATWKAVVSATTNASIVVYMGHGNGWPSPYGSSPNGYITKDGFGLNTSATNASLKYYGEPSIETLNLAPNAVVLLFHLCYASGNSEPGKPEPSLSTAKARADNYGTAFLKAGASAVIADGHMHSGYLTKLFTSSQSLSGMWRGMSNYHGHEIAYDPSRSSGSAILDPDKGGSSPSGFYRSIVGNLGVSTSAVIGQVPVGAVTVSREDGTTATSIAAPTWRSVSVRTVIRR